MLQRVTKVLEPAIDQTHAAAQSGANSAYHAALEGIGNTPVGKTVQKNLQVSCAGLVY